MLRQTLRRAGSRITPYQLRHTFAQTVADRGDVPVGVLARLLGHTDITMTRRYFEVRDKRALSAVQEMGLPWGGP